MINEFRKEVRSWLDDNLPASMRTPMPEAEISWGGRRPEYASLASEQWMQSMVKKCWIAPHWPQEYGGAGLSMAQADVLNEELALAHARPPFFSFGLWMLGPILLEYGSQEQCKRFLPPIARGEIRWCQGYSEPGAGSDLASLSTSAQDMGDHWLVNGQKIWTSYADKSDWIFCLVRTDNSGSKHSGISFLLIDMQSDGISTQPIKLISGSSPFCETFFDDVKVPKENLVGDVNGGWAIAKKLLQYERQNVSAAGFGGDHSLKLETLAKQHMGVDKQGCIADASIRLRIAELAMQEQALDLLMQASQRLSSNGGVDNSTSLVKCVMASNLQERHELVVEILGAQGLGWEDAQFGTQALDETIKWLRSKGNSIEGGTSEVNLNIIAKRILGLPS